MTLLVSLIAVSITATSAIDACGLRQYSEYFHISEVVGSLATGKPKFILTSLFQPLIVISRSFSYWICMRLLVIRSFIRDLREKRRVVFNYAYFPNFYHGRRARS